MKRLKNCPNCEVPFEDSYFPCRDCSDSSNSLIHEDDRGDLYAVAQPAKNIADKNVRGVWQVFKKDGKKIVYFRCFICGWLNNISDHEIRNDGRIWIDDCVTCPKCQFHQWLKLEGWKKGKRPAAKEVKA